MALSLAGGLRRKDTETTPEPADRGSARMETVGAVLLWVAWSGVLLAAGVGDLPLPALLIVIAVTIAAGALSVLLVELLFSAEPQHRPKVAWAALAGLVAAPGAYAGASFAELLLLGAAAGLSYQLLVRILNRGPVADIELAAALAAGGLWGTMAPVLFGKGGILYVGSVQVVLPQLLGLGVALVLATASGRLLALPAVRIDLLRARL
jgi:ammonia channel protein AmtB